MYSRIIIIGIHSTFYNRSKIYEKNEGKKS